ncbi:hypothetical protein PP178_04055 [Zeaxanthinibacter sp. PT1]|uniref:A1S_2505 family phage non-structural protein n=1 Tax=Zeaxanthinibacter TaxID=561554 RepID=UPI00234B1376|nr:hypothetical protein [Zeaxanthinibacter sp. PT1]MDC6350714.1 hypothetical protein [Zeaxanthinibacter sp. PT1]
MAKMKLFKRLKYWWISRGRITPDVITKMDRDEIFVFGSNLDGNHAGGAAAYAARHFGAEQGIDYGFTGDCYAIPTVGQNFSEMSLSEIEEYVDMFFEDASHFTGSTGFKFLVTQIGCGIAGFTPEQIAPMFKKAIKMKNVHLPREFWEVLINE